MLTDHAFLLAMIERQSSAFVGVVSLRIPALAPDPWTIDASLGILGDGLALESRLAPHRGGTRLHGLGVGVNEIPTYGGPPRLGDIYLLARQAWQDRLEAYPPAFRSRHPGA